MNAPLATLLVALWACLPAQQSWVSVKSLDVAGEVAIVFDTVRQRSVLCGNSGASGLSTWEKLGSSWIARSSAASPPARTGFALAYDSRRGRVVLFGGFSFAGPAIGALRDTWEWDGGAWQLATPAQSPPARYRHAMAYDSTRGRVLLFGGMDAAGRLGDTWEWDGVTWARRAPGTAPAARSGHALVYDRVRARAVLFGGSTDGYATSKPETWEWDGSTWLLRSPAISPPPNEDHGMAYDSRRGCTVLFGGYLHVELDYQYHAETWEWDGSAWSQRSPAVRPQERAPRSLAYDEARGRTVCFGGTNLRTGVVATDCWEWDASTWSQTATPALPAPGAGALAHDSARGRTVLVSGSTWEWDGAAWLPQAPVQALPPRTWTVAAYDSARSRTLVFGGRSGDGATKLDDLWEWDGVSWAARHPAARPPARYASSAAFDTSRKRFVIFGGLGNPSVTDLGDTWEWDGTSWRQAIVTPAPAPRSRHALAFDAARGKVVLFGGYSQATASWLADTWEWDGTTWGLRTPATSPPARANHALTFDAARGRVVLFGGAGPTNSFSDTWDWDGSSWSSVSTPTSPGARALPAMAYDGSRQEVVLFGGVANQGLRDTWLHGDVAKVPAAALLSLGTGCAGTSGIPVLTAGVPYAGNPAFVLDLSSARGHSPCLFGIAAGTQVLQLGGGCTLYLASAFAGFPVGSSSSGFASLALAIPSEAALLGARLYAQGGVVDPHAPHGLALSAGLAITVGY